MIIYVTGKSGSGKSTLAKLLAQQLGHKYIDIDKVGHMVYDNPDVMQKIYNLSKRQKVSGKFLPSLLSSFRCFSQNPSLPRNIFQARRAPCPFSQALKAHPAKAPRGIFP